MPTRRSPRRFPPLGRLLALALGLCLVGISCCARRPASTVLPVAGPTQGIGAAIGSGGAVASAEPAATEAGLETLRAGGNAVDAAVAVALALAVVHPQAGNLGGGGFAVLQVGGHVETLDFRETAPAGARRTMYLGPDGKPIPEASWVGPLAAGVPGSPAGLFELQRRHGALPWSRCVAPAVRLARDGFTVTNRLHDAIEEEHELLAHFPETAAIWLPGGQPLSTGTILKLPDLAATLEAYAERGPEAITSGAVASALVSASKARGGILTAADLAAYRPVWREPLLFKVFGWEVAAMPLPSSGGTIVAETCALLERIGWKDRPRGGPDRDHLLVEAWRRAYADRFVLGDPATTLADARQLLDPAWIAFRASSIDPLHATPSLDVRPWPGRESVRPAASAGERGETTHLSVVDGAGDLVALTTTLNGWFGCGLVAPGGGFFLNNEMDDFTTAPGLPNAYGLIQGEANAVRPGRRMLSSMSPMIAWRDDESLALGSPGGSRIPTATMQVFFALVVDGDPLQTAVERPRFHHQWLPDEIAFEKGALPDDVLTELTGRGHKTKMTEWRVGEVDVVRRRADRLTEAAADPRGPGGAGVVRPLPRPD
jgi:gamma-glutamyltranspeptidase / glutathione hydrolase